ncbi:MAG: glycosyltransferase family 2 protein [Pseudarcicella sp.]|nr:glycosyltransferase family 2 protein [Pseudarcicella sp.]MBP6410583.1 glycosyltransferase family 2 protein [Pseudarcicella sp.]
MSDYSKILASPYAPTISIVAPAYNEEVTIVDNIRSLLSLHYNRLEIIIVNDGSKDNTLKLALEAYRMVEVNHSFSSTLKTKKIRGIYKSNNPAFKKIIIVDKENGGKADAINAGINISSSQLFACIDVDCILEPDALLKMAKPFMEESDKTVIATGGIVWLTNDAIIKDGRLIEMRMPKAFIVRMQVVEYIRAFLIGRTVWAKINGMMLISGALGLFRKNVALAVGGYNHNTVGEDMDLVMRMHKYMLENKLPYKVAYIPEPLCMTEAPSDYTILGRQRTRWARGTIECMLYHKIMMMNPKYGILGLLSYPYWLFAEWMAPIVEALGVIFFVVMSFLGLVDWQWAVSLLVFVYVFSVFIGFFSIYLQELVFYKYTQKRDLLVLMLHVLIEPFLYHPRVVWWSLKGNFQYFTGTAKGWGEMTRKGFNTSKKS